MKPARKTWDLCQDCWQDRHPDDYPPDTFTRYGECEWCGNHALRIRCDKPDNADEEEPRGDNPWDSAYARP